MSKGWNSCVFIGDACERALRRSTRSGARQRAASFYGPLYAPNHTRCEGESDTEQHNGLQVCPQTGHELHRSHTKVSKLH